MKKYIVELNNKNIEIPADIQKQIIIDNLMRSYHWVFGLSGIMIGFLLGVIAVK